MADIRMGFVGGAPDGEGLSSALLYSGGVGSSKRQFNFDAVTSKMLSKFSLQQKVNLKNDFQLFVNLCHLQDMPRNLSDGEPYC